MVIREEMERIVREAYRLRLAEDVDSLCALFKSDALFRLMMAPRQEGPSFSASDAPSLRTLLARMMKSFQLRNFVIDTLLIDGDLAAVHWTANVRSGENGQEAQTHVVDLIEIQDGKIISMREFCDTALMERMVAAATI